MSPTHTDQGNTGVKKRGGITYSHWGNKGDKRDKREKEREIPTHYTKVIIATCSSLCFSLLMPCLF